MTEPTPMAGDQPAQQKMRTTRSRIQPLLSDVTTALAEISAGSRHRFQTEMLNISREHQLLLTLRGYNFYGIKNTVIEQLKQDALCSDVLILRKISGEQFRIFSSNSELENISYSARAFPGILEVLNKKLPLVLDKASNFNPWKVLFYYQPKTLMLIPVVVYRLKPTKEAMIECIAVLSYRDDVLPKVLADENVMTGIFSFCNFVAPLLYNLQRHQDITKTFEAKTEAFESIQNIVKQIQDVDNCIHTICLEAFTLFHATYATGFLIVDDLHDAKLLKYCSFGSGNIHDGCPQRESHFVEELPQVATFPAGWSALHKKCLRANDPTELVTFCGAQTAIHSTGGCFVKNIMCFVINDLSNDMSLLIELSDKSGGFTEEDEQDAILFSKRVSSVLTSSVMLDHRKKAVRRNDITNKVIRNIKTVTVNKVQHLIEMKFNFSNAFRKKFLNYRFVFSKMEPSKLPNLLLYMFTELELINRWKMRRATLIRFILSIKQAYRDNPYHNWRHACASTHFAFVLLKQTELQKNRYITDVEALAFFIACLCHDVDHRGINSRFMTVFNQTDNGQNSQWNMIPQEEGLVQRQHLTLILQVLTSDDCNIVENMFDEEYREFIELLQLCILSTDIGYYLQNREKMFESMKFFEKNNATKRRALLSILMIMCNLCDTVKPWDEYLATVKCVFSEFFSQGDEEAKHGVTPNPTMDRRKAYIPLIETKFINEVIRPAYQAIADLLPKTEECLTNTDYFKELWLVSTKIFEMKSHLDDPLDILSCPEMKEENLKTLSHPELQQHVSSLRKSFGHSNASLPLVSSTFVSRSGMELNSMSFHATDPRSAISLAMILPKNESRDKKCKCPISLVSKVKTCLHCHHRGIDDASILRKCNQEDAFLEEQSHIYERKRSIDSGGDDDPIVKFRTTM